MTDHFEEEAQLDQLKAWWHDNYKTVLFSLGLGLSVWGGLRAWQWYHHEQLLAGSADFIALMPVSEMDKLDTDRIQKMTARSFSGVYPISAQLKKSQLLIKQGSFEQAAEILESLVNQDWSDDLSGLLRVRLARIYLQQNNYEAMLSTLAPIEGTHWLDWADWLRSSAYHGLGQDDKAKLILQAVMGRLKEDSILKRLVMIDRASLINQ